MTSPQFPEPPAPIPPTPLPDVDTAVERVAAKKDEWTRVPIADRIALMKRCMTALLDVADAWVKDGCLAKGIAAGTPLEGEEWIAGPWQTMRNLRFFVQALTAGGQPRPSKVTTRPDGQTVVRVFPANVHDKIMFTGFSGEVWLTKGRRRRREPRTGPMRSRRARSRSSSGPGT